MAGVARLALVPADAVPAAARDATPRLATWLLVSLAVDLVVTRFLVRLAIFIPKQDPWTAAGAGLGRVGAAADALVPILGVALLTALLLRAGRAGDLVERLLLTGIAVMAGAGLLLVLLPPTPTVAAALDLCTSLVAAVAGVRMGADPRHRPIVRVGLVALAGAVAMAALARAADAAGASGIGPGGLAPVAGIAGQWLFVGAIAVLGTGGLAAARGHGGIPVVNVVAGGGVAIAALAVAVAAPLMWGALAIWSGGLTGVVPAGVACVALGLGVAGIPALHARRPGVAVGAGISILAGFGLAASGLALAGLLGLAFAGSRAQPDPTVWDPADEARPQA